MAIKIEFKSALRSVTGISAIKIDKSFNTLEKVMNELIRMYPALKDEMFYSDGTMDYIYQIIHNSRRLSWLEDKEVRIKDGDVLLFMVFMAGG